MTLEFLLPNIKSNLLAYDAKDGRLLFDTHKNKAEYIAKYKHGEVLSVWADFKKSNIGIYSPCANPVIKCYLSHGSWLKGENETD